MPQYPKYATTVIGAHSVPDWYEALDRLDPGVEMIGKPFSFDELGARIRARLDGPPG